MAGSPDGTGGPDPEDALLLAGLHAATAEDVDRLRAAVEAVRRAAPPLAEWHGGKPDAAGVIQMPYPDYHPVVWELVTALELVRAVVAFDWMSWSGARRYRTAADVRDASVADAVRLITSFVRGERFADGTIDAALDDGRLLAAAERLLVPRDPSDHQRGRRPLVRG